MEKIEYIRSPSYCITRSDFIRSYTRSEIGHQEFLSLKVAKVDDSDQEGENIENIENTWVGLKITNFDFESILKHEPKTVPTHYSHVFVRRKKV